MKLAKGLGEFFGLDIDTNAVRVVQLSRTGAGWSLSHYGYTPVDSKITSGDSPESKRRLGEAIMTAVGQAGIKTSNVAVGLPSNKTFSTIIDVPKVPEQELKAMMKYQIDHIVQCLWMWQTLTGLYWVIISMLRSSMRFGGRVERSLMRKSVWN